MIGVIRRFEFRWQGVTLARNTYLEVDYDDGMRGLLWIVALAACGKQSGVQISVLDHGLGAKQVRLFVGTGDSVKRTISNVGPNPFTGEAWSRDPGAPDDFAAMTGNHADFFFEDSAMTPIQMPIVIAVGFDAGGAAVGVGELMSVDVPSRGLLHYDITLDKAGVNTWDAMHPATGLASTCVAFGSHLIVNPDDQDCDGNITGTPKECMPDVYNGGMRAAIPNEFSCLTAPPTANPLANCVAGGPQCIDGSGPQGTCVASRYCAPPSLCTICNPQSTLNTFDCARNGGSSDINVTVPHFDCVLATKHDGELCGDPVVLPHGSATNCSNVMLRNDQQNFFPTLKVDHGQTSLMLDTESQGCMITITPSGHMDPSLTNPADSVKALMSVDTAPYQGFLVPIVFTFAVAGGGGDCASTSASKCTASSKFSSLTSDESVCATSPAIPPGGP